MSAFLRSCLFLISSSVMTQSQFLFRLFLFSCRGQSHLHLPKIPKNPTNPTNPKAIRSRKVDDSMSFLKAFFLVWGMHSTNKQTNGFIIAVQIWSQNAWLFKTMIHNKILILVWVTICYLMFHSCMAGFHILSKRNIEIAIHWRICIYIAHFLV